MQRALFIAALTCLVMAVFLAAMPLLVREQPLVEVFPVDPAILELPVSVSAGGSTVLPQELPWLVTLQQGVDGYSGCSDTYFQYFEPDTNFCQSPSLSLRAGNKASLLLRFDLTRLPDKAVRLDGAAVVQQATLGLYLVQGRADTNVGLYLPRAWDACAVTWNLPWDKPGADGAVDRQPQPWSELTTRKATGWIEWDVTGLAQAWLRDPAGNNGLMLKSFEPRWPSHLIAFSADHPAVTSRPRLTIKYVPAPPAPTPLPATPTATPPPEPTATALPSPTATPPFHPGARAVELHWHERMNAGNSYRVTAHFRPADQGAGLVQGAWPYLLSVTGHLTAPSFTVAAESASLQVLDDAAGALTWAWNVTPRLAGSQLLSLDLLFTWKALHSAAPEPGIWYTTRVVQVEKAVATRSQMDMLRNGLAVLGLLCLVAWWAAGRRGRL